MDANKSCTANFTLDPNWIAGRTGSVLAGKLVFNRDIASTDKYVNGNAVGTTLLTWGPYGVVCPSPQCTTAGPVRETQSPWTGVNGLVADNSVNFNPDSSNPPTYPARDACKAIGGRLPTVGELVEMYNNKALYGNNFQSDLYWSSTEYNSNVAVFVRLSDGYNQTNGKGATYYVRCVR